MSFDCGYVDSISLIVPFNVVTWMVWSGWEFLRTCVEGPVEEGVGPIGHST